MQVLLGEMAGKAGGQGGTQPPDVASGFEDGDDAKSLFRLGGKGHLNSYVPYCRLAFAFQSKRPSRIGFGGADLGLSAVFALARRVTSHLEKTLQLAAVAR